MIISRAFKKFKRDGGKLILLMLIRKVVQFPRIVFYYYLSDISVDRKSVTFNQPVLFVGKGSIKLRKCFIGVWPSPFFFSTYAHIEARTDKANISIGENTWLNNNATIIADKTTISIGDNVLIGQNVFICDSDFHGLEVENRSNGKYDVAPVMIKNSVFIGANVTILKGVSIGVNSVVASGSIVSSSVPDNVVVGGIPAKIIKQL